jgi:hypothetical protein
MCSRYRYKCAAIMKKSQGTTDKCCLFNGLVYNCDSIEVIICWLQESLYFLEVIAFRENFSCFLDCYYQEEGVCMFYRLWTKSKFFDWLGFWQDKKRKTIGSALGIQLGRASEDNFVKKWIVVAVVFLKNSFLNFKCKTLGVIVHSIFLLLTCGYCNVDSSDTVYLLC